jgi:hypothetical protein
LSIAPRVGGDDGDDDDDLKMSGTESWMNQFALLIRM